MLRNGSLKSWATGALFAVIGAAGAAAADEPTPEQVRFFETRVRPVLAEHCYVCHGADLQEADLRLDTAAGLFGGGESGAATVVAGEPARSLLLTAIGYRDPELRMPPDGKLSDREIAALTEWVKMGAPHPDAHGVAPPVRRKAEIDFEKEREFWSFRPPVDPPLPSVKDKSWPQSPLDHFLLAQMEAQGIKPAPPADKRTLIRRATFDLIGLPPTPAEIEAFLNDDSPEAFAKVVERLLASPHYGERWGRHWLDVARYADSNGLDENIAHGNAWRYRDYVVSAFNRDKPYNEFVREQLAGDLLGGEDIATRHERLIASGFLSLGPKVLAEPDAAKMEMDIIDEQIEAVGRAFLGLTLGCARCHDHKYDPLPTDDYYALAGIFKSTRTMESYKIIARWHENSLATDADLARKAAHDKQVAEAKAAVETLVAQANERLKAGLESDAELPKDAESMYSDETRDELKRLREELAAIEKQAPEMPTAMGVTDAEEIVEAAVHIRGSTQTLGPQVPRGVPQIVPAAGSLSFGSDQSGRLELAEWLVSPDHPLTARVIVNRIWRWHFGRGIVGSPDNFGRLGESPTHPELLDWLAAEFVGQRSEVRSQRSEVRGQEAGDRRQEADGGGVLTTHHSPLTTHPNPRTTDNDAWSIKQMHRLIMLSSAYQMSSRFDADAAAVDPENRLFWRWQPRRLEAEAIRDALLAVSGELDRTPGGSLLHVGNREFLFNHTSRDETRYDSRRRSLYLPVIRNNLYDLFQLFDYADASVPLGDRPTSTVAPQALFLMNAELVSELTERLADRLVRQEATDDERIGRLYETAYGRPATESEVERALEFLDRAHSLPGTNDEHRRHEAWRALCHVVVAGNEFLYLR